MQDRDGVRVPYDSDGMLRYEGTGFEFTVAPREGSKFMEPPAGQARAIFSSDSVEWETPWPLFRFISNDFGPFTFDPAATRENAKTTNYLTEGDAQHGLVAPWHGSVWLNPPYGKTLGAWVEKARNEAKVLPRHASVTALLPVRADTRWWHEHVLGVADWIGFIQGRICFGRGTKAVNAPFASCLVHWSQSPVVGATHVFSYEIPKEVRYAAARTDRS